MQKITNASELKDAIFQLELKQALQGKQLKEDFYLTYESFKSINLVKKLVIEMITSPGLLSGIIRTIIELTSHKSDKQTVQGLSGSKIKNIAIAVMKYGLTNFVVGHADVIRSFGQYIIRRVFSKKEKKSEENE